MKTSMGTAAKAVGLAVVVLAGLCGQSLMAAPNVVRVGTCEKPTNTILTIQDGVNAATSGATVRVCPGVYKEQVTINKPLTLTGIQVGTSDAAVIVPPAGGLTPNTIRATQTIGGAIGKYEAVQILITAPTGNVNLNNLTVDGIGNNLSANCSSANSATMTTFMAGIYYRVASGTVTNVATRNQVVDPSGACGSGDGILVESGGTSGSPVKTSVTIQESSVRAYESVGIAANDFGIAVTIKGNTLSGQLTPSTNGQNGIQLVGATGSVGGNSVIGIGGDLSGCILGDASHGVAIVGNIVGNCAAGITVLSDDSENGDADKSKVTSNVVFDSTSTDLTIFNAGIAICSNNNQVLSNEINGSSGAAIYVDTCFNTTHTSTNNTIAFNEINEACAGVLLNTTGNNASFNQFQNVFETVATGNTCSGPLAPLAPVAPVQGGSSVSGRRAMP